ncbi:MAG: WecB/TagA/CpsF family glycosyltransferase [Anaerolineales bacterium]|nr:WecB/TagA/CpsF family glycosyltransferase [Anaerolineales bacterium]MCB8983663.1 WecB/TagA/CpsF family glycosyltransferase [Ardenticatenaceae bacterium]
MRKLILILGVPIDDLTMDEALARVDEFVANGRAQQRSHQIATVNADFVVKALHDPELRGILQEADMATADGMPLVWGARALGLPLEGRVTGADMVPALAERAAQKGYSLYFLGAAPGVAARAAEILQAQHPGLQIAGVLSPPKSTVLEMDTAVLDDIRAAQPDILLVAFGNPKQEKWIAMHRHDLPVPVMIGVGGTFDFIAGKTRRAPEWMQKSGLEWLFRLANEPRRLWKRYVVDMAGFSSFFVRQWWLMRQGSKPSPVLPTTDVALLGDTAVLTLLGRLDISNHKAFAAKGREALAVAPRLIINLAQAEFIDSTGMGALVGLRKQAVDAGGEVTLTAVPDAIHRALSMMRLDRLFEMLPSVDEAMQHQQHTPPAPQMVNGRWLVLPMPRRLDADTAAAFWQMAQSSLQQSRYLALDFAATVFLASAGLAVMGKLHREAQAQGGEVRLANCAPDVQQTLKTVNFDKMMPLFANVQAATKA